MKFTNTAITLLAGAGVILASPTVESVDFAAEVQNLAARANPEFGKFCDDSKWTIGEGKCNGSSCKMGLILNYGCNSGKCTKQSGGGDGKRCCYNYDLKKTFCPGG